MSTPSGPRPRASETDPGLVALIDELIGQLQAGEPIDLEAVARQDPARADQIRRLLPTLVMLADLGRSAVQDANRLTPPAPEPGLELGTLGDYQIIREVGRGGMGVVYEARQVSLGGRRVALKVLSFAAAVDPKHLQRFRLEAQAAALLHHPHIVPVHGVGCERSVHYYAMQFIEGRNLAELIRELRQLGDGELSTPTSAAADFVLASRLASGEFAPAEADPADGPSSTVSHAPGTPLPPGAPVPSPPATRRAAASTSGGSTRAPAFFRTVAGFGLQAAEALGHAHEQGVIHRDIKPSNLLIDHRGQLWITDFGLARLQDGGELTATGDVLGTLRYMSPEQAQGRRVVVDHRTDLYSLGVTLYELLTLTPAVPGDDRQHLLRQIAEEEPRPVRRLNPAVPADLATIVGKAMAKDPADRYATAQELADDLRRFLEHRPIQARPPTLLDRAAKWSRRHRALAATAVGFLALTMAVLAVSVVLIARQRDRAEANEARAKAYANQAKANEYQARANATRAEIGEARAEDMVGLARLEAGDLEGARSCFERAHAILSRLDAAHPGVLDIRLGRARNRRFFGMWHRDRGNPTAAERSLRDSIAILEGLAEEDPHRWATEDLGLSYETLGRILLGLNRTDEAYECFAQTVAVQRRFIDRNPRDVAVPAVAVTTQIYCPFPKLRDPRWAVEQAKKVRDHRPKFSGGWTLLGLAYYRRGEAGGGGADWEEAAAALERATELRKRGEVAALNYSGTDAHDDFGLAMAYARLRREDKDPVAYYNRAVAWMDRYRPQDVGLRLLRAEAAGLLGVDDRPGPGPAGPAAGPR